jgi:(E)-4-hydroxy-3-methylbut-2-enyl-diphosphate synthase
VIKTVEVLEQRLSHIKEPLTLSIIGCVVNGPVEASQTDIGLTGGGKGNNMIYLSGIADHKVPSEKIIDHIVSLVEKKAEQIRNQAL